MFNLRKKSRKVNSQYLNQVVNRYIQRETPNPSVDKEELGFTVRRVGQHKFAGIIRR